jgi:hypothetical protein
MDSADTNIIKKLSWLNIKNTLKTYFDTLYNSPIFGQSFYQSTNNNTVTNNSTSGYATNNLTVVVHSYSLTAGITGTYHLGTKFNFIVNQTNVSSKFRWYLDNVAIGSVQEIEVNDSTNRLTWTEFYNPSLNNGNHTLELRVASETSSITQTIYSSSVEFWRVS